MAKTYRDKRRVLSKNRIGSINRPKIRKGRYCWEDHWLGSTPSWWSHMMTTKKRRREGTIFEAVIKHVLIEELELHEPPTNWKKPHVYYW